MQAWRPTTRQRYQSAIGQLAAVEAQESPDLGMAEVLVACLSEKSDEGQSASGMRGIFSAVRALEDMCIDPPLVGAIHRRIAGRGGAGQGRRIMRPQRCSATCGSGRPRRGTAPSWPLSFCPGSAFGGSVSRRQSAPLTYLMWEGYPSTARSRAALGAGIGDRSSSLACPGLTTCRSTASDRTSPQTNPSSARGRRSLRTASPLSSVDHGGVIMHGTASGEEAQPPVETKSQGCPTLNGGGAGLLLGLPCATRQLSLIMECWRRWPCHALDRKSGSLRWSIAYLFGVLLCLGRTRWKSPWVTWGPSLVLLSHTLALWLLSRLQRRWGAATAALLAMNWTVLLQAPRAPAPASFPTRMSGSSSHRSGGGFQRTQPSGSAPRSDQRGRARVGGHGGANASDRHPRQPPGKDLAGVELGLWASLVILKGGGRLARRWEWRLSPPESPPHPSAVFLGPAPRKLRLGQDHRLNDVPLAMRGRARVRSSRPRAFQRNSKDARGSPDPLLSPLSCSSSSAHRHLDSSLPFPPSPRLPCRPPPPPGTPPLPALVLAAWGCDGGAAFVCPVHEDRGTIRAVDRL